MNSSRVSRPKFCNLLCLALTIAEVLAFPIPSFARSKPIPLQKSFDAPVERVFAAEAEAAGSTIVNTVRAACLVNFQTKAYFGNGFYRVISWTAVCKDAGSGKTTVTLSGRVNSNSFGNGGAERKDATTFWSNMDAALANGRSSSVSASISATSQPIPKAGQSVPVPSEAVVQISSEPSDADFSIDGDYQGNTPSQIKLKPGSHSIMISKAGFNPWERSINVKDGEVRNISARLEKPNK